MSFATDCDAVPELTGASKPGLRALNAQDAAHVRKRSATRLSTSVDIDTAFRPSQPTAARWDYGVGQRQGEREIVHWIEVHPASGDNNISQMRKKLNWLRSWLHGRPLASYERQVVWVASGKSTFNARDPQLKALAQDGLLFAGGYHEI
jgi:hypothetical protein